MFVPERAVEAFRAADYETAGTTLATLLCSCFQLSGTRIAHAVARRCAVLVPVVRGYGRVAPPVMSNGMHAQRTGSEIQEVITIVPVVRCSTRVWGYQGTGSEIQCVCMVVPVVRFSTCVWGYQGTGSAIQYVCVVVPVVRYSTCVWGTREADG
eukprot:242663-Rhodomonas_salina.1